MEHYSELSFAFRQEHAPFLSKLDFIEFLQGDTQLSTKVFTHILTFIGVHSLLDFQKDVAAIGWDEQRTAEFFFRLLAKELEALGFPASAKALMRGHSATADALRFLVTLCRSRRPDIFPKLSIPTPAKNRAKEKVAAARKDKSVVDLLDQSFSLLQKERETSEASGSDHDRESPLEGSFVADETDEEFFGLGISMQNMSVRSTEETDARESSPRRSTASPPKSEKRDEDPRSRTRRATAEDLRDLEALIDVLQHIKSEEKRETLDMRRLQCLSNQNELLKRQMSLHSSQILFPGPFTDLRSALQRIQQLGSDLVAMPEWDVTRRSEASRELRELMGSLPRALQTVSPHYKKQMPGSEPRRFIPASLRKPNAESPQPPFSTTAPPPSLMHLAALIRKIRAQLDRVKGVALALGKVQKGPARTAKVILERHLTLLSTAVHRIEYLIIDSSLFASSHTAPGISLEAQELMKKVMSDELRKMQDSLCAIREASDRFICEQHETEAKVSHLTNKAADFANDALQIESSWKEHQLAILCDRFLEKPNQRRLQSLLSSFQDFRQELT